jgi:hypothetical protein
VSKERWIQPPMNDRPQDIHAGQPMSPSASEQLNDDVLRRELSEQEPASSRQRIDPTGAPLFVHGSNIKGVVHPRFSEHHDEYKAATSPTQAPNDQGRKSVVPG